MIGTSVKGLILDWGGILVMRLDDSFGAGSSTGYRRDFDLVAIAREEGSRAATVPSMTS